MSKDTNHTGTIFNMGNGDSWDISTPEGIERAIAWTDKCFGLLANGGRWIVPRSMSIYEVNHETKTVRRISGAFDEPAIRKVIEAAGWKYVERNHGFRT